MANLIKNANYVTISGNTQNPLKKKITKRMRNIFSCFLYLLPRRFSWHNLQMRFRIFPPVYLFTSWSQDKLWTTLYFYSSSLKLICPPPSRNETHNKLRWHFFLHASSVAKKKIPRNRASPENTFFFKFTRISFAPLTSRRTLHLSPKEIN